MHKEGDWGYQGSLKLKVGISKRRNWRERLHTSIQKFFSKVLLTSELCTWGRPQGTQWLTRVGNRKYQSKYITCRHDKRDRVWSLNPNNKLEELCKYPRLSIKIGPFWSNANSNLYNAKELISENSTLPGCENKNYTQRKTAELSLYNILNESFTMMSI